MEVKLPMIITYLGDPDFALFLLYHNYVAKVTLSCSGRTL